MIPYESRCRPTSPPTTAAPQFSVPVDVASHTGAMQAQEHRIQRWAVATRTRNPSQEALMSCFSQRITRIRRTESTWKSPEPRITRITRILHSSFFIWRSAPSFFTSEDKNSSNSCNFPILIQRLWGCPVGGRANRCGNRRWPQSIMYLIISFPQSVRHCQLSEILKKYFKKVV